MSAFEQIPEQPETVAARPIVWIFGATIAVIVACVVVVWSLEVFHLAGGGEKPSLDIDRVPPARPFSETLQPELQRREVRNTLDRWMWADTARMRVRVPVDVAIDRYLQDRGAK